MTENKTPLFPERGENFVNEFLELLKSGIIRYTSAVRSGLNRYKEIYPDESDRHMAFELMSREVLKSADKAFVGLPFLRSPKFTKRLSEVTGYTLTTVRQMAGSQEEINRLWKNDPYRWIEVMLARLTSIVYQVLAWLQDVDPDTEQPPNPLVKLGPNEYRYEAHVFKAPKLYKQIIKSEE